MVLQHGVSPCTSRLMYGGGHYTEALGLSSVGELGGMGNTNRTNKANFSTYWLRARYIINNKDSMKCSISTKLSQ